MVVGQSHINALQSVLPEIPSSPAGPMHSDYTYLLILKVNIPFQAHCWDPCYLATFCQSQVT